MAFLEEKFPGVKFDEFVRDKFQKKLGRDPTIQEINQFGYKDGQAFSERFPTEESFNLQFDLLTFQPEKKPPSPLDILRETGITGIPSAEESKTREEKEVSQGIAGFEAEQQPIVERQAKAVVSQWLAKGRIRSQGEGFLEAKAYVITEANRLRTIEKARLQERAAAKTERAVDRAFQANLTAAGWTVQDQQFMLNLQNSKDEFYQEQQLRMILSDNEIEALKNQAEAEGTASWIQLALGIIVGAGVGILSKNPVLGITVGGAIAAG